MAVAENHMGLDEELRKAKADLEANPPLARADYLAALDWVKARFGGDLDRFFRETSVEQLMSQPLGPNSDCLSIQGLEAQLQGTAKKTAHFDSCRVCQRNLKLMQELEQRAVARAAAVFE